MTRHRSWASLLSRKWRNWQTHQLEGLAVISLDKETPRDRRFEGDDDEKRLLNAADHYLRGFVIAMLDTCCRPGEILSLQWRNVDLIQRELTIQIWKANTRSERIVPMSSRLLAVLEMRRLDPAGETFGPNTFVFGNEVGERMKSIKELWKKACQRAGIRDLRVADLRHEAAS